MINEGLKKEDEMIYFINGKKINELSNNLASFVKIVYGVVDPEKVVECAYTDEYIKPDFVLTCDGRKKYVSMKSGKSNTVHSEKLISFVPFLQSLGISEETINTLLMFHYGDGTTDGSGQIRYTSDQMRTALAKRIELANDELNRNNDLIVQFTERVLFQGVNPNAHNADCIYFGDYEWGTVAMKKQIMKHMQRKFFNYPLHNIHVGPFLFRPCVRYVGRDIIHEDRRHKLEVYWPNMREDIEYIARKYDSYTPMRYRTYEE